MWHMRSIIRYLVISLGGRSDNFPILLLETPTKQNFILVRKENIFQRYHKKFGGQNKPLNIPISANKQQIDNAS